MIIFHKYHGAGNDFIMIDNLNGEINISPELVRLHCDRHFGIGADGVILLEKSDKADCFMNYYNSDGTIAEMCGNGVRCTAKFFESLNEIKAKKPYSIKIDTRAGVKEIIINTDDTYSVDMGVPKFVHSDFPSESKTLEGYRFDFVSMGNPHAVTMVSNLDDIDFKLVGKEVENSECFPNKINVEFVEKKDELNYRVKVWERGCGATLACGTGACAVFAVLNQLPKQDLVVSEITLQFPGGKLFLSENEQGHIILRGPALFVFQGEI